MTNRLKNFLLALRIGRDYLTNLDRRATKYTGGDPQNPAYWVHKLFGRRESKSGIEVDEDVALTLSAVWSAVTIISGAVGFLPLMTYRRLERGKDRAVDHKLYRLLHTRPNPYMSAQVFRETLQGHVLLWGNGYASIERDGAGRPLNLWPILPNRVTPDVSDDNKLIYKVKDKAGKEVVLSYDMVFHIAGLGFDGLKGYSVVEYCGDSLGLGKAAENNAASFFANDSSPAGILSTEATLSKETKEELEKRWKEKHQSDNRYDIAVLHGGLKYHPIGIPAKDAQLLESRKYSVNDVARWFTIPPHMIGDLERATFSNIEHQGIQFVTFTLQRWLRKWELECDFKLLSGEEQKIYFAEFVVDGLLKGDSKARYESYSIGRNGGWLSVNDIREKENMNPVDDGDVYLEPLNMVPAGSQQDEPVEKDQFRDLFESTWKRIVTKEVKAIRKAAKNPATFPAWLDRFYSKHEEHVSSVIEPALQAFKRIGFMAPVVTRDYIRSKIERVKVAFAEEKLDELLDGWEESVPVSMSAEILKGV